VTTPRLPGPRGTAQLGYLRRIFKDPAPVLDELRARHGPVVGLGFGPARMAIVGDPALLDTILSTPVESFRWGHKFNVLGFVVGEGSMIVSDGPDHKRRRGAVQQGFSIRRLHGWIPMIVEQADSAVYRLAADLPRGDERVDLYPVVRRAVLEVAVRAFFGERLAQRAVEIGDLFQRPQDYLESPAVKQLPHPIPWTRRARVRADRRALDAIIDIEIADRRARPSEDALDLLDALAHDDSLSDSEIRDQVVTLIGAGYDTTAASLSWILWCCATAPGLWDALRDEADAVLGPVGTPVAADPAVVARLELADRVMRETLRLHPAGVVSPREAVVDLPVDGHVIPAGTLVLWSAHLAGRDPDAWPDPLRFDPDRFRSLTAEQRQVVDQAWVPFGRGPRRCIGFALAQLELVLLTARLAQRVAIDAAGAAVPAPIGMVVNRPRGGVPMSVRVR
jgi:cytochrome P450